MRVSCVLLAIMSVSVGALSLAGDDIEWTDADKALLQTMLISEMPLLPEKRTNRYAGDQRAAALGHKLFFDQRFSSNGEISCSSCHQPDKYFTDGKKVSQGLATVKRNAPTIVGINQSNWFFLDGRADSLWAQALGPLEDPAEHGGNRSQYAHIIYNDEEYREAYEELFGEMPDLADKERFPEHAAPLRDARSSGPWRNMVAEDREAITQIFVNMGKAIAAYEHKLRPAPSRFDHFVEALLNDDDHAMERAMDDDEVAGLRLFIGEANCVICHNGPALSDFEFHNVGTPLVAPGVFDFGRKVAVQRVRKTPFNCQGRYNDAQDKSCDELKYINTDAHTTLGTFRTPTLRNVSKTAPYMHAGQYETLEDVVRHYVDPPPTMMGESDTRALNFDLDEQEQGQLLAFLKALDSDIDAEARWLKQPE